MLRNFLKSSIEKAVILADAKELIERYGDAAHLAARFRADEAADNVFVKYPPGHWRKVEDAIENMKWWRTARQQVWPLIWDDRPRNDA